MSKYSISFWWWTREEFRRCFKHRFYAYMYNNYLAKTEFNDFASMLRMGGEL
jgi:hypothetical protein